MTQEITNMYWEDVEDKQALPPKGREIDTTLIAMGAVYASHDFMPVHHDRDFAQSKGAPDIFMNILTSNGLLASYLEQWAGPRARLKKMSISLQVPNFPNDTLAMSATVLKKFEDGGEHLIEVQFSGENKMGSHIVGTAVMALPSRG